jgi:hypothetical protein
MNRHETLGLGQSPLSSAFGEEGANSREFLRILAIDVRGAFVI